MEYLRPGARPPLGRTRGSVTGSPALRLLPAAVFAVDGAAGVVMEEMYAANRPDLETQGAAGFGTMLPVFRDPSAEFKRRRTLRLVMM